MNLVPSLQQLSGPSKGSDSSFEIAECLCTGGSDLNSWCEVGERIRNIIMSSRCLVSSFVVVVLLVAE